MKGELKKSKVIYGLKNPIFIGISFLIIGMLFQCVFADTYISLDIQIIIKYLTTYAPLVMITTLFLSKKQTLYDLGYGIVIFGLLYFFILIFIADIGSIYFKNRRMIQELSGVNPISIGRTFGMLFILSCVYLDCMKPKKLFKAILIMAMISSLYMMFFVSTRQVIISVIMVLVIYGFIRASDIKSAAKYSFLVLSIFAIGFLLLNFFEFTILNRLRLLQNYQEMYRFHRYQIGLQILPNISFWGFGAGYFSYLTGLGHAHNLFLGMAIEYGFVGIMSYTLVVGTGLVQSIKIVKLPNENYRTTVFILIWYMFIISTMFSGDSTGDRSLWTLSGLLATIMYFNKCAILSGSPTPKIGRLKAI